MTRPTPWTPERVSALRAMWRDGVYARVIGDQLGAGITRNAVIGKAHRLGLGKHVNANNRIGVHVHTHRKPTRRRRPPPMPRIVPPVTAAPEPPVARQEPSGSCTVSSYNSNPVTIMELRFPISQCRYIAGKPSADALYCGARTRPGSPYCPEHHRLCNIPYVPRRRKEAAE